jgi:hypothetical protein
LLELLRDDPVRALRLARAAPELREPVRPVLRDDEPRADPARPLERE